MSVDKTALISSVRGSYRPPENNDYGSAGIYLQVGKNVLVGLFRIGEDVSRLPYPRERVHAEERKTVQAGDFSDSVVPTSPHHFQDGASEKILRVLFCRAVKIDVFKTRADPRNERVPFHSFSRSFPGRGRRFVFLICTSRTPVRRYWTKAGHRRGPSFSSVVATRTYTLSTSDAGCATPDTVTKKTSFPPCVVVQQSTILNISGDGDTDFPKAIRASRATISPFICACSFREGSVLKSRRVRNSAITGNAVPAYQRRRPSPHNPR